MEQRTKTKALRQRIWNKGRTHVTDVVRDRYNEHPGSTQIQGSMRAVRLICAQSLVRYHLIGYHLLFSCRMFVPQTWIYLARPAYLYLSSTISFTLLTNTLTKHPITKDTHQITFCPTRTTSTPYVTCGDPSGNEVLQDTSSTTYTTLHDDEQGVWSKESNTCESHVMVSFVTQPGLIKDRG